MSANLREYGRRREHRSFYYDLLRVPYREGGREVQTGLDCMGVVWEVLMRLKGERIRDRLLEIPHDVPRGVESSTLRAYLFSIREDWQMVSKGLMPGDARLGDVVLQMVGREHDTPHVSVVVWNEPPVTLLTAHRSKGVIAVPASRAQGIVAVYRLRD